jgi:hypothetical protein
MTYSDEPSLRALAQRRVGARIGFVIHLICYLACLPVLLWPALRGEATLEWTLGSVLGWGLGVAIHGVAVFVRVADWRERLVVAEMERLRERRL